MTPLAMAPSAIFEPADPRREAFAALRAGLSAAGLASRVSASTDLVPSAIPTLDHLLGGGFPGGMLVTLEGPAGRWSIAARLAAGVTRRALVAIVDDGGFYPPSLARAGARLDRVLVVPARTPLGSARAVDILLRSRICRLILLAAPEVRAAVWMRLAGLAHRAGVLLIAIVAQAAAPLAAAAGLRLVCTRERLLVRGTSGLGCTFGSYGVNTELRKHKGRSVRPQGRPNVALR